MRYKLKSFFTEHWKYMAVSTACKLNIFDHLKEAKTAKQLANELLLNEDKLLLLLNALSNTDFLHKNGDLFKVNSLSELLTEHNPKSLKYACLNWSGEHLTAWQNLEYSIKTGLSSFEEIYGKPFFDFLNDNPIKLHAYQKAMYQYAKDDYKTLPEMIDFSKHKSVMDVGGGYGAVLENIKTKYSNIECILFDLPEVIEKVTIPSIHKVSGNFFEKIPNQSEAIVLTRVLHDWNDKKASLILKNCFEALPENGTLYVIENLAEQIKDIYFLSLSMSVICESYERTKSEYVKLLTDYKFDVVSITPLNDLQYIIKAIK